MEKRERGTLVSCVAVAKFIGRTRWNGWMLRDDQVPVRNVAH
jgi:hypothetical protein